MAPFRLIDDGPPQALKDLTHVRITAVVQSDDRITYDAPRQDAAASSQTITETRKDESYRGVKRDSSSAYSEEGSGEIRNDAAAGGPMEALATRLQRDSQARRVDVGLTIPWVDFRYRVGDRVSEIDGRDIPLETKHGDEPSYPMIRQVAYDFEAQQTDLHFGPGKAVGLQESE